MHSVHWGINPPPFFLESPLLKSQTVQAPLSSQAIPPLYWFFVKPPPRKTDFSVNPNNINVFHP